MKRTVTILLVAILLLTGVDNITYADQSLSQDTALIDSFSKMLTEISADKKLYGMDDCDFTKLSLGEELPAYEVLPNGLRRLNEHYYPILHGGKWVITAIVAYNALGEESITLSPEFQAVYNRSVVIFGCKRQNVQSLFICAGKWENKGRG